MPVDPTTTVLPQTSQGPKNDEKPGSGNSISPSTPPTSDEEQISPVERPHPERTKRGTRWFLVCLGIFSANFLYGLDTTIAADIQAAVSETFENVTQLGWLGFGFCLGSTVAILPLGKMYAVFDTKWMFIGSLVMFAAGSALCGGPANINGLIVGRVWAGAGGAGMYLGTLNLVTAVTTPREQAFYVALEGFVYGGGCIVGPVIGGLFADSDATWRWAFYLNLVIFAVMGPIYLWAVPSMPRHPEVGFLSKLRRLDWLGILLTAVMYVCFVVALGFGGTIWNWNDARFIALMVISGIAVIAFAITQHLTVFTNKLDRLFPCEFLGNPQLVLLYIAMSCGGAALFVATYYIPLYFLFVHGESGTEAAVRLLPFMAFYVFAILLCGYAMPVVGHAWAWYLFSGLLLTAGGSAMYTINSHTPLSHTYGFFVLLGLGLTISQAGYALAPHLVKADRVPEVIQFLNISQGQSQMLGLVVASAIFQNEALRGLRTALAGRGYTGAEIQGAVAGSQSELIREAGPELRELVLNVIVGTIQKEYILIMTAGALLTVCALLLPKKRF